MKYEWLNNQNNNKLIIFFNGWGMDESVIKHLESEDYDVIMFYDYNDLETDFKSDKEYSEINVVAWSMGVMVTSIFINKLDCFGLYPRNDVTITVINGTLKPIDEKYGINPKIYDLTIRGFNEANRDKFINNMFDEKSPYQATSKRSIENLKSELIALKDYNSDLNFTPDKIFISKNDKIIPTKNQSAFWGTEPNLDGGHCPFFNFKKWSELL